MMFNVLGFYVVSLGIYGAGTANVRVGPGQSSLCPQWTTDEGQFVSSCPFLSTSHSNGVWKTKSIGGNADCLAVLIWRSQYR